MRNKPRIIAGARILAGATAAGALYTYWDHAVPLAGMAINYVRSWSAPPGTTTTELAAASKVAGTPAPSTSSTAPLPDATTGDWPSYNKTLTSERYSGDRRNEKLRRLVDKRLEENEAYDGLG